MIRTEWTVDNNGTTLVRYNIHDNEIRISQADDLIRIEPADVEALVQALIEATEAVGIDMPDLSAQGYSLGEDERCE